MFLFNKLPLHLFAAGNDIDHLPISVSVSFHNHRTQKSKRLLKKFDCPAEFDNIILRICSYNKRMQFFSKFHNDVVGGAKLKERKIFHN